VFPGASRWPPQIVIRYVAEALPVFEFRVTKYDPAHRNAAGAYTRDDWTSFSDVGRAFHGTPLTRSEYDSIENAYVTASVAFLREAGVSTLAITGLENSAAVSLPFGDGALLDITGVGQILRRILREEFWCRLESAQAFVHVGWDFYMYVGVPSPCPGAVAAARKTGLFVEAFLSPYNASRSPAAT
jgi:hypothetical protein